MKPDPFVRAGSVIDAHGKTAAEEVVQFEVSHLKAIGDLVKRENIECDYVLTRTTDVCLYEKGRDDLKAKLDKVVEAGITTADDVFYSPQKTAEAVSNIVWCMSFADEFGRYLVSKTPKDVLPIQQDTYGLTSLLCIC